MTLPTFRGRALVATLMLFGFTTLVTSGFVLYASPTGRVARDLGWSFLTLDKWQWRDMHMAFALLFLLTALCHVWLNFKPLKNYIRQKLAAQQGFAHRWRIEPALAVALCVLLGISAIKGFPPAQSIADARETITQYWEESAEK
ncbi:MAG: DUF4405 domain-containing protein [Bdellovibrionales bacterium]